MVFPLGYPPLYAQHLGAAALQAQAQGQSAGSPAAPAAQRVPRAPTVFSAPGYGKLTEHFPEGIEGRIQLIRDRVSATIRQPEVRFLGLQATHGCPWRDDRCEVVGVWWFMHKNIRYTGDIEGHDTYQSGRVTLRNRGGDCDDGMPLAAGLLMANGFKVKARITSNPNAPKTWAHIYPLVGLPKMAPSRWVPFDWTLGHRMLGAHPPQAKFLDFDGYQIVEGKELRPTDFRGWP